MNTRLSSSAYFPLSLPTHTHTHKTESPVVAVCPVSGSYSFFSNLFCDPSTLKDKTPPEFPPLKESASTVPSGAVFQPSNVESHSLMSHQGRRAGGQPLHTHSPYAPWHSRCPVMGYLWGFHGSVQWIGMSGLQQHKESMLHFFLQKRQEGVLKKWVSIHLSIFWCLKLQ